MCAFLTSTRECGLSENCQFGTHPWYDKIAKVCQNFPEVWGVLSSIFHLANNWPTHLPGVDKKLFCILLSCSGWVGGSPALAIAQIFCIFCTPPSIFGPRLRVGLSEPFNICLPPRLNSRNLQFLIFLKEELVYTLKMACLTELLTTSLWLLRWWLCSAQGWWFLAAKKCSRGNSRELAKHWRRLQKCWLITSFWLGRIRGPDDIKIEIQLKT